MTSDKLILLFLSSPEIMAILALMIPPARKWLLKMVEDSDGDPHHTDGFFVAILWCGTICIRTAIGVCLYDIAHTGTNVAYVVTFLSYGTLLLGVRAAKNALNLGIFQNDKTKNKEGI